MKNKINNFLSENKMMTLPKKMFVRKVNDMIYLKYDSNRQKIGMIIEQARKELDMPLLDFEAFQVYNLTKTTENLEGDLAEVGVYKGGSAMLICEAKGKRKLHLFDTFEGMPETEEIDSEHYKGQFYTNMNLVQASLVQYEDLEFHKGRFPEETGIEIGNTKFSFVHLDSDLYRSTLDSLNFFYSRMVKGGIILIHDYLFAPGVTKAVKEFLTNKKEVMVELPGKQCIIIKTE